MKGGTLLLAGLAFVLGVVLGRSLPPWTRPAGAVGVGLGVPAPSSTGTGRGPKHAGSGWTLGSAPVSDGAAGSVGGSAASADGDGAAAAGGAGPSLGLPRPLTDSWLLARQDTYEADADSQAVAARVRSAVAQAKEKMTPSASETPVDSDEDGVPDLWVYRDEASGVYFVEADRTGSGVHDLRARCTSSPGDRVHVEEPDGWFTDPPVPLPCFRPPAAPLAELLVGGWPDEPAETEGTGVPARVSESVPDFASALRRVAQRTLPLRALLPALTRSLLRPHLESALRTYVTENLAKGLVKSGRTQRQIRYEDLDGDGKPDLDVEFSPAGPKGFVLKIGTDTLVASFAPRGSAALPRLSGVRIVAPGGGRREYVRLGALWFEVRAQARRAIARTYVIPAWNDYRAGRWYSALARWKAARSLAGLLGDLSDEREGDVGDRLVHARRADWAFEQDGWPAGLLLSLGCDFLQRRREVSLSGLAEPARRRDGSEGALGVLQNQVRLCVKVRRTGGRANALEEIGSIFARRGVLDRAAQALEEALELRGSVGYAADIAANLPNLVNDPDSTEQMDLAIAMRTRSLAVARAADLAHLAALRADLGDRKRAELCLGQAEALAGRLEHRWLEADLLALRGEWHLRDGRIGEALRCLERARKLAEEAVAEAKAYEDPAESTSKSPVPFPVYRFVLPGERLRYEVFMRTETDRRAYLARLSLLLAETRLQQAEGSKDPGESGAAFEKARSLLAEASTSFEASGEKAGLVAVKLSGAALAWRARGLPGTKGGPAGGAKDALAQAEEAQRFAEQEGTSDGEWRALALRGEILEAANRPEEAIRSFEEAAGCVESLRAAYGSETGREAFFLSKGQVYERLAALYDDRRSGPERAAKIFETMERARSRAMLDLVAGRGLHMRGKSVLRAAEHYPVLAERLRSVLETGAPRLLGSSESYEGKDAAAMRELQDLVSVTPLGLAELQAGLDDGDLLIEYAPAGSRLLALVVGKSEAEVVRLDVDPTQLDAVVGSFFAAMSRPGGAYRETAERLGEKLLAPCLRGRAADRVRRLAIVPYGPLFRLPFHALLLPGGRDRFVIEEYAVAYEPSAAVFVHASRRAARLREGGEAEGSALVVAAPETGREFARLPRAEEEGNAVLSALQAPKELLKGRDATVERIRGALQTARVFHFAGHGDLRPDDPLSTALICAPDGTAGGRFEAREIFGLALPRCELAVLSACETQAGAGGRGEDLAGLGRAFLCAGIPRVVATLWKIDDRCAGGLMARFHELRGGGRGRSDGEALAESVREFLAASRARSAERAAPHPYLWAAFIHIGAW